MSTGTTIADHRYDTVEMNLSRTSLVVTKTGALTVIHGNDAILLGADHNLLTINGTVTFISDDMSSSAIDMQSTSSRLNIGTTGQVIGFNAIEVSNGPATINNAGTIQASSEGVAIHVTNPFGPVNGIAIHNSGGIYGSTCISLDGNSTIVNERGGLISGVVGIGGEDGHIRVTNHGRIQTQSIGGIVIGEKAVGTIVNDGVIRGAIVGNAGNDSIDNRGGVVSDGIAPGAGDDTVWIDSAKVKIIEEFDAGTDTVKSAVSFKLPNNVEKLYLLGHKNLNGTGNDSDTGENWLFGNSGNNILSGLGGPNYLFGGKGADTLIGGEGQDYFAISPGYGHDVVRNYVDGEDTILLMDIGGQPSEIKKHIEQHGNDTWIVYGKDALILKGVDHHLIDQNDFTYFHML